MEQKKTVLEKDGLTIEFNPDEFQESRPDFQPINVAEALEVIKSQPKSKKSRIKVEKDVEYLIEKETGIVYKIVMGKIPVEKERIKRDITASMLTLELALGGGEQRLIMFGYTKEGAYSPANQFEIYKQEGESND